MAYHGPSNIRDNFKRFQKQATINLKKQLQKDAEKIGVDVRKIVAEKLEETYKRNVEASYHARSIRGQEIEAYNKSQKQLEQDYNANHKPKKRFKRKKATYHHTGIFLDSIYTVIEKDRVKIKIKNRLYPNGATTKEVYEYLTEGTEGGGYYPYAKLKGKNPNDPNNYELSYAYNYPTPVHEFELHTQNDMNAFLETLDLNNYTSIKKYKLKKRR